MIRLFLDNRTGVLFLLPLILGVYVLASVLGLQIEVITRTDGLFFQHAILGTVSTYFLQSFLLLLNAVLLNAVFNSHEFLDKNTYIISLIYLVLTPMFVPLNTFDGTLLAHSFMIFCLSILFQLKQNSDGKIIAFNAGLFVSMAILFMPYLLLVIPFILMMIVIIRPFIWRELILFLSGVCIPIIYYFSYLFFTAQLDFNLIWPSWGMPTDKQLFNVYPIVGLFAIIALISLFSLGARLLKSSLRLKKQIQMLGLLFAFFILLGSVDFFFSGSLQYLSLAIIPLTYFLTYAFLSKRSGILASIFFYITLLYSFVKFFISFTE